MSRFPYFNRSNTVHTAYSKSPQISYTLDRSGSLSDISDDSAKSKSSSNSSSMRGRMVKKICGLFETQSKSSSIAKSATEESVQSSKAKQGNSKLMKVDSDLGTPFRLPDADDRVVVYFTSLRGVRRTFEDCSAVRMILKGFRIWIDERDVSMDAEYRKELQCALGEKNVTLPQVFVRGKYIGGADVIRHLFEVGELGKILEGFPKTKPGFVCESCADLRFAPCWHCSGSRKVFDEDEGLLKRCLECNENGLIRCPNCCS
ncbi:hypothetical protein HN51_033362 [Arachis hypogaea]|uniref:Glutaredoxin domain-containing protein n=2 Tax=Arachis TaxID=3817 RepID=A0A445B163_ARAHY|nr:uncharacterized protein At5g39865 [Arachis duranensis]XP_025624859.1 uncharacterized protein At5g39865 [Arachis hypogaea]XP_057738584.1 uncharacterized protein At5g39865 [Arachis stenosperma]RYR32413.1 hypothetical protein Ahy_A10g046987 [Arachis hypogaea]